MKVRIKFSKLGTTKFVGHLDIMRFFQKAIKRAELDIAYSEGYSPHQVMSFASPLGVGLTSDGEYLDVVLNTVTSSEDMTEKLNQQMVEGIKILSIKELPEETKNAMSIVGAADYIVKFREGYGNDIDLNQINEFISQETIVISKKSKKSDIETDIKPMIISAEIKGKELFLKLKAGSAANLKPDLFMKAFYIFLGKELPEFALEIHRLDLYDDNLKSLESAGEDIS